MEKHTLIYFAGIPGGGWKPREVFLNKLWTYRLWSYHYIIKEKDIMTKNPKTIASDAMVVEALNIMEDFSITQLVVADQTEYKGILHLHDILKEGII